MDLATTVNVIQWILGGVGFGIVILITWIFKVEKKMTMFETDISNMKDLDKHLVKAGENIKEQLVQHDAVINEIRLHMKYANETTEKILQHMEQLSTEISHLKKS